MVEDFMIQFHYLLPFLEEEDADPASRMKMLTILKDSTKIKYLKTEMMVTINAGRPFIQAT